MLVFSVDIFHLFFTKSIKVTLCYFISAFLPVIISWWNRKCFCCGLIRTVTIFTSLFPFFNFLIMINVFYSRANTAWLISVDWNSKMYFLNIFPLLEMMMIWKITSTHSDMWDVSCCCSPFSCHNESVVTLTDLTNVGLDTVWCRDLAWRLI